MELMFNEKSPSDWDEDVDEIMAAVFRLIRHSLDGWRHNGFVNDPRMQLELAKLKGALEEEPLGGWIREAKLFQKAKDQGYVTYDEIHAVLPNEKISSQEFEEIITRFSELGISIVENSDFDDDNDDDDKRSADDQKSLTEEANPLGYVYVFSNPAMPGLYKIGHARDVEARRRALSNGTMVPDDFIVEAVYETNDSSLLEKHLHRYFDSLRHRRDREFFRHHPHMLNCGKIEEIAYLILASSA